MKECVCRNNPETKTIMELVLAPEKENQEVGLTWRMKVMVVDVKSRLNMSLTYNAYKPENDKDKTRQYWARWVKENKEYIERTLGMKQVERGKEETNTYLLESGPNGVTLTFYGITE